MQIPGQYQQFQTHRATTKHKQSQEPNQSVFEACKNQSIVLLHGAMQESIKNLLGLVTQDCNIVQNQKPKIYPIVLKHNQLNQLPIYLQKLIAKLNGNQIQWRNDQFGKVQQSNIFPYTTKQFMVKQKKGTNVRDIMLDIYADSENVVDQPSFKLYVYVITEVTDLSEQNLYIFSKGVTNKHFVAFLPTHQTFDDQKYEAIDKLNLQKTSYCMYDQKLLFSKYIYNCLNNPKIKAYLPAQILTLVTDMSYYSLSFFQSCRRFDFCLQKALRMNPRERLDIYSQMAIQRIENILKKKISVTYQTDWLNILRVILNQEQTYKISYKSLLSSLSLKRVSLEYKPYLTQQEIDNFNVQSFISGIIQSFRKHLPPDLLRIFQLDEEEVQKKMISRSRKKEIQFKRYGFSTSSQKTAKMILEGKITRIIKNLSKNVRNYSRNIKWRLIKFNQRIKPSIPLKLADTLRHQEDIEQLVEEITNNHFIPLSSLFALYDEQTIGEGLYLIKTLELSGLITLSRKQINPLVYNNFYQKSKFN